jgi:GNAT superfamily N-acetyltransferase
MTTASLRDATPSDHPTFAKLFRELGVEDPVPTHERFAEEMLSTTLIAECDGDVAGYAFFRPMKEIVHLSNIVTAPHARRRGVGRALMNEVARRARAAGCSTMSLNVRTDNHAAIALYESFGLARTHVNHGLEIEWAWLERQPEEWTALAKHAREIAPDEDAALETQWQLPSGILAEQRARPNRVLREIRHERDGSGLVVFDVGFPGAHPFRASDRTHALSLLRAVRPFARPEDGVLHLMVENHRELADDLVRAGARLKLETVFMRGRLV